MAALDEARDSLAWEEYMTRGKCGWDGYRKKLASQGVWLSKEGEIKISDMCTSHIENCLEFIKGTPNEELYTPLFIDELNRRLDNQIKKDHEETGFYYN